MIGEEMESVDFPLEWSSIILISKWGAESQHSPWRGATVNGLAVRLLVLLRFAWIDVLHVILLPWNRENEKSSETLAISWASENREDWEQIVSTVHGRLCCEQQLCGFYPLIKWRPGPSLYTVCFQSFYCVINSLLFSFSWQVQSSFQAFRY